MLLNPPLNYKHLNYIKKLTNRFGSTFAVMPHKAYQKTAKELSSQRRPTLQWTDQQRQRKNAENITSNLQNRCFSETFEQFWFCFTFGFADTFRSKIPGLANTQNIIL
jgi:hypothetical protein